MVSRQTAGGSEVSKAATNSYLHLSGIRLPLSVARLSALNGRMAEADCWVRAKSMCQNVCAREQRLPPVQQQLPLTSSN